MMTYYHVSPKTNKPGVCVGPDKCKFKSQNLQHFTSKEEAWKSIQPKNGESLWTSFKNDDKRLAEEYYDKNVLPKFVNKISQEKIDENRMKYVQNVLSDKQAIKNLRWGADPQVNSMNVDNILRENFFNEKAIPGEYTFIDTLTGTVLPDNGNIVVTENLDEDEENGFYDDPESVIKSDNREVFGIHETIDLSVFENPVIVDKETGTILSPNDLYAVKTGDEIVDFDEILEDSSVAEEVAHEKGFRLWQVN